MSRSFSIGDAVVKAFGVLWGTKSTDSTQGETIDVTDGGVHARLIGSDVPLPADISNFSWLFGDDSSTVTIAASTSSDSPPIDMRKLRRTEGTVHVVLTGTGTAKLTAFGSRDGVNNLHSLGDRLTGMVVGTGSYILKLDDSAMAYFPYLTFRITETGGANSVSVKAYVVARGG